MSAPDPATSTAAAGEYVRGEVVGDKYRIDRVLGQGGMGTVYLAMHTELDEPVALKVLLPAVAKNPEAVSRFLREAKASVRIKGEHVARVLDAGRANDTPFMVMEFLEGCDLGTLIENEGAQSVETATEYILQAADAVAQAHALGIVHRDLKPQNLFLTKRPDGTPLIKVLDFGISKAEILGDATFGTTSDGTLLGSPAYMAPEQIRSAKGVSTRADLWSLGIILYELLTAESPFEADTVHGLLLAISISEPTPIRTRRADVPDHVVSALDRCLCKVPEERPADVGELAMLLASAGTPAQKIRAERVVATLRAVAERVSSSSHRISGGAADTLALASGPPPSLSQKSAPPSAAGSGSAPRAVPAEAGLTSPMTSALPPHPLARVQSRLARLSPRAFGGVLAGIFVGVVLAVVLTRNASTNDGPRATTKHAPHATASAPPPVVASAEAAPSDSSMPALAPASSATTSTSGAGRASIPMLPASSTNRGSTKPASKGDDTPAPIRKAERAGQSVGRFLDCKLGGNCK